MAEESTSSGVARARPARSRRLLVSVAVLTVSALLVAAGGMLLSGETPKRLSLPSGLVGGGESASKAQGEVDAVTAAGQEAFAKGDFAQAQDSFLQAARLEPDNPWLAFNLGAVAGALGDLKGAAGFYQLALGLNPDITPAHYNLGYTLAALGDDQGAVSAYRKAVELEPTNASALWNLGLLLYEQGKTEEAQDFLRKAAALDESLLQRLPESVMLQ